MLATPRPPHDIARQDGSAGITPADPSCQVRLQDTAPLQHLEAELANRDGQPERRHSEQEHPWYRQMRRDADGRQSGGQHGLYSADRAGVGVADLTALPEKLGSQILEKYC